MFRAYRTGGAIGFRFCLRVTAQGIGRRSDFARSTSRSAGIKARDPRNFLRDLSSPCGVPAGSCSRLFKNVLNAAGRTGINAIHTTDAC